MPATQIISFLSLIVALSAYIATIRLRLIDRIQDAAHASKKATYKFATKTLMLADIPLLISGVFLFFHGFWPHFFSSETAPAWLLPWSVRLFGFAGIVLIGHHIFAWWKSITA